MTDVIGIRTIVLYVADTERSANFWINQIGLCERNRAHGRIELDLAGTRFLLHPTDIDEHDQTLARHGRTEVYLEVSDLDALVDRLVAAHISVLQPPTDQPWGERDAALLDPDGHPLFLTQVAD
jgi:uncharacterized glyoxalase superfamily protein PhnB